MRSVDVRPHDAGFASAARLAGVFAASLFVFHLIANLWQSHTGWGYFRDEFYYIACGRHLAWGYVDHGPLVAVQARLSEVLFGHSLAGLRALSALGGSGRVFLTGLLVWALGGRRPGQSLAMFAVATVPQYLGTDGYLSMNSWESLFWLSALLAVIQVARTANPRWWLLFGAASGLGLLNKPSMTFMLVALLAALLLTPQRRLLATPWAAAGVALMLVIVAPYLHWQIANGWPTWEFLHNGQIEGKNKALPPLTFLWNQVLILDPASALVWIPGLLWLLRRIAWRFLGLTFLLFLAGMIALHAKDYYVTPIYPILYAAGGLEWEQRFYNRRLVQQNRAFAFPLAIATLVLISAAVLPMDTPVLSPRQWIRYAKATHQYNGLTNSETLPTGPLDQFYADRFGWQEMVDKVRIIYNSLTPAEKAQAVIQCDNYGEAGAINFLAPDLPTAISAQNNFWLWGPGTKSANILIDMEDTTAQDVRAFYDSVQQPAEMNDPFSMPHEHKPIFLLKGEHQTIQSLWPDKKDYI
jgi:hypothetical protein